MKRKVLKGKSTLEGNTNNLRDYDIIDVYGCVLINTKN